MAGAAVSTALLPRRLWPSSSGGGRGGAELFPFPLLGWPASGSGGEALRAAWDAARAAAVAPALAAASWVCLALSAMLLADAVFLAAASALAQRRRPYRAPGPIIAGPTAEEEDGDEEAGRSVGYPMVLVQIPMYNEREVRVLSLYFGHTNAMRCWERWFYTIIFIYYTCKIRTIPFFLFFWARRCTSYPLEQHAGCRGRRIGSSYRFSTIPLIRRLR